MTRLFQNPVKGQHAVFAFATACMTHDLLVSRPILFDIGYDLIIHNRATDRMWRVQVKTAYPQENGRWLGSLHRGRSRHPDYLRPGLIDRFIFAKPGLQGYGFDGFWIVDAARLERGKGAGLSLKEGDAMWEDWAKFAHHHQDATPSSPAL